MPSFLQYLAVWFIVSIGAFVLWAMLVMGHDIYQTIREELEWRRLLDAARKERKTIPVRWE